MKKNLLNATPTNPPPPLTPDSKSPRKTLITIAVVVIIIIAVAVGAYLLLQGDSSPDPTGTPTPSPGTTTPSPGTTLSPGVVTPSPSPANSIETAESIQFSASHTSEDTPPETLYEYTWSAKNIGTPNMMIHIEGSFSGNNMVYIVNGAQQKAWIHTSGMWVDISHEFYNEFDTWGETWQEYEANLQDWAGSGDWTYTTAMGTTRIYDITVNPELPDSLFQP